uniref:Inositol polyphosphate-related phosphatase domain-containing protein n=1 Tax=Salix viminalis TaxID=40686 RepID=A0A6N2MS26_SALVM
MRTRRGASFHGLRHWSRSGSISRAKLRNFKQMMSITEVVVKSGGTTSQRERHAPSRKAKQRHHAGGTLVECAEARLTLMLHKSQMIFVATWNVAGKSPPSHLNLEDWLHTSPPADIYVLGNCAFECWKCFGHRRQRAGQEMASSY